MKLRSAVSCAAWMAALLALLALAAPALAQTCPTEVPAIDNAKSNKLFLYFPTFVDSTFPSFYPNVSPARPFNAAELSASIGTTGQLIDQIQKIVVDDYCEFNVQVTATTINPVLFAKQPARQVTVAIGSDVFVDSNGSDHWGQSQGVDTGDSVAVNLARVWAGTYTVCEGGKGPAINGCSGPGALTGANATLANWSQAIGGTAAHEAGHTFGLAHSVDDPNPDPCTPLEAGQAPIPGEDPFNKLLMPAGCNLTGPDRTTFRRHFSDRSYGILASNVGLSVETMHNWDLVNPNAEAASSLVMDFLSKKNALTLTWSYSGAGSPWLNPTVSGPSGQQTFQGQTYNKFRITWSSGNPTWTTSAPGIVAGGEKFHIGTAFAGVDFNAPNPIIIQDVTLNDASSKPLALHPRLPSYDAGAADGTGSVALNLLPPKGAPKMILASATVFQLPRLATIDSMVGDGQPYSRDRRPIRPWARTTCRAGPLGDGVKCPIARLGQPPHVQLVYRLGDRGVSDCRNGIPKVPPPVDRRPGGLPPGGARDSTSSPDFEGPICAGTQRDPFPAATVYVIATFVDPQARHFDPAKKDYVVGPVVSKLFYQFAGTRRVDARERR